MITNADQFAGAALLARLENGKPRVLFDGAYGLADREKAIANTIDTRIRIGSMNKMFTATAILRLVQAGKIRLTDPVGRYITDYPNREIARDVTIHHLLSGGAPGVNGDLRIYPSTGYVFVVLSNLDPPAANHISTFMHDRIMKW